MESVKKQEPFQLTLSKKEEKLRRRKKIIAGIKTNKFLYVMILPGVLYFLIFRYLPMGGLVIAFQDYQPFLGIMGSPWVGFKHFIRLFTEPTFFTLLRNTLILFGLNIFVFFSDANYFVPTIKRSNEQATEKWDSNDHLYPSFHVLGNHRFDYLWIFER